MEGPAGKNHEIIIMGSGSKTLLAQEPSQGSGQIATEDGDDFCNFG